MQGFRRTVLTRRPKAADVEVHVSRLDLLSPAERAEQDPNGVATWVPPRVYLEMREYIPSRDLYGYGLVLPWEMADGVLADLTSAVAEGSPA